MESIFQYRRLRKAVEEDLAKAKAATATGTGTGTHNDGTGNGTPASDTDEKEHQGPEKLKGDEDLPAVPGVTVTRSSAAGAEEDGGVQFVVGWKENDPENPQNWSMFRKWWVTLAICFITIAVTVPSSIDAPVQTAFQEHYGVGDIAGSLTTGMFLIGLGVGSLFSGPLSETLGRNLIYMSTMTIMVLWIMAKALAPNYGSAIVFRFLTGFFASAPMTCAGGTIADVWNPLQITFAMPAMTGFSYMGPIAGPIIAAYLPEVGFRWADWVSMILAGAVLVVVLLFQPETFSPLLLEWRAHHLRALTGDPRYRAEHASTSSLGRRLLANCWRPFRMTVTEPIILVFSFYLIILYVVLFTFMDGYPYIFQDVYGISESLTFIIWCAMLVGAAAALPLVPIIYGWIKKDAVAAEAAGKPLQPEVCLYWGMCGGSIALPVALFWMGWTCYPDVSIWSPIVGSAVFGYGLVCIFTTTYMYICFVYLMYAASALSFMTFSRYIISGALLPAATPMYEAMGPHWTLTMIGILAAIMAPLPWVLFRYGHQIRAMSKNVQNKA